MDISDRKRSERQLQHLADHDALTGLFNRRRFAEELKRSIRLATRHGEPGRRPLPRPRRLQVRQRHPRPRRRRQADRPCRSACWPAPSARPTRSPGSEATSSRSCSTAATARGALVVAEKLLATLRRDSPTEQADRRPHLSSSIGIAMFGEDDVLGPDEIVVQADIAMYDAKRAGRDRCAVYDRSAGPNSLMSIRQSLERAAPAGDQRRQLRPPRPADLADRRRRDAGLRAPDPSARRQRRPHPAGAPSCSTPRSPAWSGGSTTG